MDKIAKADVDNDVPQVKELSAAFAKRYLLALLNAQVDATNAAISASASGDSALTNRKLDEAAYFGRAIQSYISEREKSHV